MRLTTITRMLAVCATLTSACAIDADPNDDLGRAAFALEDGGGEHPCKSDPNSFRCYGLGRNSVECRNGTDIEVSSCSSDGVRNDKNNDGVVNGNDVNFAIRYNGTRLIAPIVDNFALTDLGGTPFLADATGIGPNAVTFQAVLGRAEVWTLSGACVRNNTEGGTMVAKLCPAATNPDATNGESRSIAVFPGMSLYIQDGGSGWCCTNADCNDGKICDNNRACVAPPPVPPPPPPPPTTFCMPGACADTNPCTIDSCDEAMDRCWFNPMPSGSTCPGGTCEAGICRPYFCAPGACADTNPCTIDSCDEAMDRCWFNPAPNGTACPGGSCQSGTCAAPPSCAAGLTNCGGATPWCVNLQTDPYNCGGCYMACPAGNTCEAGTCRAPTFGFTTCGSEFAQLSINGTPIRNSDSQECNAMTPCGAFQTCVGGSCRWVDPLRAPAPGTARGTRPANVGAGCLIITRASGMKECYSVPQGSGCTRNMNANDMVDFEGRGCEPTDCGANAAVECAN